MNKDEKTITEITLLLGMAYGLLSRFKKNFTTKEQESFQLLTERIDKIFYKKES
jgi:hypothetical protein